MTQPDAGNVHVNALMGRKKKPKKDKAMVMENMEKDLMGVGDYEIPAPKNMLGLTAAETLEDAPFTEEGINFRFDEQEARHGIVCGACRFYLRDPNGSSVGRCQILPESVEVPWFWTSQAYIWSMEQAIFDYQNASIEKAVKEIFVPFVKADDEKRVVTGPVLIPDTVDAQGDIVSKEDIEAAAHKFMMTSQEIQQQHNDLSTTVKVVESYIAPQDMMIGNENVPAGTWVMSVYVPPEREDIWKAVKEGDLTGFSIRGVGKRMAIGQ